MLSFISTYRSHIMGVSIVWIMLYHMPYLHEFVGPIIGSAILIGFCGVDIFFFLSAFGLFFSLQRNPNILDFYKKRVVRIFPTYLIVLIIFGILNHLTVTDIIKEISMVGMFLPFIEWPMFDWYVPAQLFFYLLSPIIIFYAGYLKKMWILIFIGALILNYLSAILLLENSWDAKILFLITRIPVFVLGVIVAKMCSDRVKISRKTEVVAYIIMLVSIFILFIVKTKCPDNIITMFGLNHFPFLFATLGFIFLLIRIFRVLPDIILKMLNFIGKYSLELYLIHWNLYRFRKTIPCTLGISEINYLLLCFILSFPLAYLLSKLVGKIIPNLCKLHAKSK